MLKAFLKDIMLYLPSKLLPALTGFITAPILSRLFLPEEYADYALARGIAEFLFAMACSGIASVPIRFLPAHKSESEVSTFFTTLGVSVGVLVLGAGALGVIALLLLQPYLPAGLYSLMLLSVGIFMGESVFQVFMGTVQSQMRSGIYTFFELLNRYGSLGLGLLLILGYGFAIEGLLLGELLALTVVIPPLVFVAVRGTRPRPRHFSREKALTMWQYGWPLAIGNTAMWGLRLADRYVIGIFRPEAEVGLYSMAYNLSGKSIDMLVALFLLSMAPMVIHAWESDGREVTEETLRVITRLFLILCLPAAAGLTVLSVPFVSLLTTEAYAEGAQIVGFIAFSSFAWGLAQIAGRGMLIKKQTGRIAVNQIIAAAVNLALNLILVPRFGFVMAGVANLVGFSLLVALQAHASHAYLTWRFPFRTLRNVLIATVLMGAVVALLTLGEDGPGVRFVWLLVSILVGILTYFTSLLILGEIRESEKSWARKVLNQLVRKAV